jgi:ABC-2 type transport system ATP-binding protein
VLRGVSAQDPTEDRERSRILHPEPEGKDTLTQALRRLDAVGVAPEDVALRKPTLDEVFLALTGHRATTPTGNGPDPRGGTDRRSQQQPEGVAR